MENKIQIFKNETFGNIRVLGTSEQPLFCLADICKALNIQNTSRVANELLDDDLRFTYPITDSLGREQNVTFTNEGGLYTIILRSKKLEAKLFRKWVTNEVLPTIRKTGGYVADTETFIENYFGDLDDTTKKFLLITLNDKKRLQEENKRQKEILIEQAPKVDFYNEIVDSKDTCDMNTVAKTLNCGIGRNRLFSFLRSKGILLSNNQPSQLYVELGWFRVLETKYSMPNGDIKVYFKTVVYQKGIDGIRKFLNKINGK